MESAKNRYDRWLEAVTDADLHEQLVKMDEKEQFDSFYRELEFGTAGLRGVLGAGTGCKRG